MVVDLDLAFRRLEAAFVLSSRALSLVGGLLARGDVADTLRHQYNLARCSLASAVLPRPTVAQLERLSGLVLDLGPDNLSWIRLRLFHVEPGAPLV